MKTETKKKYESEHRKIYALAVYDTADGDIIRHIDKKAAEYSGVNKYLRALVRADMLKEREANNERT